MDKALPTLERIGATEEVRSMMKRTMPGVDYYTARVDVLLWWKADAEGREAANSASPSP